MRRLIALTCGLLIPAALHAQRSVLLVGVGDAATGAFVQDAEVRVRGVGLSVRTDVLGRARIPGLASGTYTVEVRRVGYAPLTAPVRLSGRDSLEVVLLIRTRAAELPAVSVTDTVASPFLREFEERRRTAVGGHFITTEQIDRVRDYDLGSLFLTAIPGLRLARDGLLSLRGNCRPLVYWNGVRVSNDAITDIVSSARDLGGVEYYTGDFVPVQYRTPGRMTRGVDLAAVGGPSAARLLAKGGDGAACGVLLLWPRP